MKAKQVAREGQENEKQKLQQGKAGKMCLEGLFPKMSGSQE